MNKAVDDLIKKEIEKYKSEKFREELIKKYEDFDFGEFEPGDLTDTDEETEKKLDKYLKLKHVDKDTLIAYYNYKDATKDTKEELKEKFYSKINKYIDNKIKELESGKEEKNNDGDNIAKNKKEFKKIEIDGIKIMDLIEYLKSNTDEIEEILSEIEESDELDDEEKKLITKEINKIKEANESLIDYNIFEGTLMAKIAKKIAKKISKKDSTSDKDSENEETEVKDKDGVVWIKRKKERGDGYTYCKKDDRSVTMSQDEYKKRHQKESYYISLTNYLTEALFGK